LADYQNSLIITLTHGKIYNVNKSSTAFS